MNCPELARSRRVLFGLTAVHFASVMILSAATGLHLDAWDFLPLILFAALYFGLTGVLSGVSASSSSKVCRKSTRSASSTSCRR